MEQIKRTIEQIVAQTAIDNESARAQLSDSCTLTDYAPVGNVWTSALQQALNEHQIVVIPESSEPYMIDGQIVIPSDRHIIADGATVKLTEECKLLMLRNEGTCDGTHIPLTGDRPCRNITITGGTWAESNTRRAGYGHTGKYDDERSLYGVSTLMFFENLDRLTLRDMTFVNCAGFAVQLGDISNVVIENIKFDRCFADGIHVGGNTENILVRNVTGEVGDDLVAFNSFDWLNSSVNYGPLNYALCEDIALTGKEATYPAIRLQAGIHTYDDGTTVDCSLNNAIFRRFSGIRTFKMYCQTPRYKIGTKAERGDVGSGSNLFFEEMEFDLTGPIDKMQPYMESDPVRGTFAAFELGLNIDNIVFKDISITLYRDKFPYSYLACIGPKSVKRDDMEIFDPNFSSHAGTLYFENIKVNGERVSDITPYIREIQFDKLYDEMPSSGKGTIGKIICK